MLPLNSPRNFLSFKSLAPNTLQATAYELPRFLYPEDQEYDPDDIENGLFRGHYLLFVSIALAHRQMGAISTND